MRDYGTGAWDGGDADCDHKHSRATPDGLHNGTSERVHGPHRGGDTSTCGKCGATRIDQQQGLEQTPEEYVTRMVEVFREVRRVLRADGTCWINIGDSYANGPPSGTAGQWNGSSPLGGNRNAEESVRALQQVKRPSGLKPKDLVGIPWRVAFALQADGWYLRSDIIWAKPNPMPESVTDRPTKAHEYVFLLSKSPRYFFDKEAVREPAEWARWGDQTYSPEAEKMYGQRIKPRPKADLTPRNDGDRWNEANGRGFIPNNGGRNIRSVWEIATQPYPEAHFATFPEALVDRIIRAGTSERGCCPVCGAPWERIVEVTQNGKPDPNAAKAHGGIGNNLGGARHQAWRNENPARMLGWRPTCACCNCPRDGDMRRTGVRIERHDPCPTHAADPIPCTVLDPFIGSGTTALVARRLGRKTIGIELNPTYCELAARRLQQLSLLAVD